MDDATLLNEHTVSHGMADAVEVEAASMVQVVRRTYTDNTRVTFFWSTTRIVVAIRLLLQS